LVIRGICDSLFREIRWGSNNKKLDMSSFAVEWL
jgi:hypothetical protein